MVLSLLFYCCSSGSHRFAAATAETFTIGIEKRSVGVERTRIKEKVYLSIRVLGVSIVFVDCGSEFRNMLAERKGKSSSICFRKRTEGSK